MSLLSYVMGYLDKNQRSLYRNAEGKSRRNEKNPAEKTVFSAVGENKKGRR